MDKKRRHSHPHEGYKVMASLLRSESARQRLSARSRRTGDRWKKSASGAKTLLAVEGTQGKEQKLKHGRFADSVSQSRPIGYESSQYLGSRATTAGCNRNNTLLPDLRGNEFGSLNSSLVAFLRFDFMSTEHSANLFFSVEEAMLLRELILVCRAYQYARRLSTESTD